MPNRLIVVLFLIFSVVLHGQTDTLHSPLNIPLYLSGTFGELRTNHFHSGLDIKTNGQEGLPVFAVDDGYVYRIKISHNGYGKALYVKHPSGLISVYGHLKYFNDAIERYIKRKQYKKQSFEIEVFPYKIELPVKKGEIIAYSGNTGGSFGAHLHFELRNLKEHPLNPMSYGIHIDDHIKPVLKNAFVYPLDSQAHVNQLRQRVKLNINKINDSVYVSDTVLASGKIGIGIEAYDLQDKSYNRNGLYRIKMKVNGLTVYEHVMEEFSFFNSHYINTLIDYPYFEKYKRRIVKLWVEPYNFLEIYTQLVNDGIVEVDAGKNYQIQIILSDFNNNNVELKIPVFGYMPNRLPEITREQTPYKVIAGQTTRFVIGDWQLDFLPKTAYFDFYLSVKPDIDKLDIEASGIPLHRSFLVKYPLQKIARNKQKYVYLARKSKKRKYYTYSVRKNDSLVAYTKRFGTYVLAYDSIPPVVKPLNFKPKANLTDYQYLKFKIFDKQTGIKSYNGYIDNRWILLEYDYKKNRLTYDFSDMQLKGYKHRLKLIVVDKLGNRQVYQTIFYRKETNNQ